MNRTKPFVKRPVATVAFSLFISLCFFGRFKTFICIWTLGLCIILMALGTLLGYVYRGRKICVAFRSAALISFGIVFSLCIGYKAFVLDIEEVSYLYGKECEVTGAITEVIYENEDTFSYIYEIDGFESEKSLKVVLVYENKLEIGDVAKGFVTFSSIEDNEYYLSRGAVIAADALNMQTVQRDISYLKVKGVLVNRFLYAKLTEHMSDRASGVCGAVLLGNRQNLAATDKRDMMRNGIIHLIAISGMHVACIYATLTFLTSKARIGKRTSAIMAVFFFLFFMVITGCSASVVRAVLLSVLGTVVMLWGVSYDSITTVGVCACLMVLAKPGYVFDAGMQLSFCSYLGCIAAVVFIENNNFMKDLKEKGWVVRFFRKILSSLLVTCFVTVFTLPISLLHFENMSALFLITNFIFIPLFSLILYLSMGILILSPIPTLCAALSFVTERYVTAVMSLSSAFSHIEGSAVSLNYSFAPYVLVLACACVIVLVSSRNERWQKTSAGVLCFCIVFYSLGVAVVKGNDLRSAYLCRVGDSAGEALLLQSEGEVLVCSGDRCYMALDEMQDRCIAEPDAVLFNSYGEYQIKSLRRAIGDYIIRKAYLAFPEHSETPYYFETVEILESEGAEIIRLDEEDCFTVGNTRVTLSPERNILFENRGGSAVYMPNSWNEGGSGILNMDYNSDTVLVSGVKSSLDVYNLPFDRVYFFGESQNIITGNVRYMDPLEKLTVTLK